MECVSTLAHEFVQNRCVCGSDADGAKAVATDDEHMLGGCSCRLCGPSPYTEHHYDYAYAHSYRAKRIECARFAGVDDCAKTFRQRWQARRTPYASRGS